VLKVGTTVGVCVAFSVFFTFNPIYGQSFILLPAATAFLLPLFFILGLSVAGWRYLDRFDERAYAKAWMLSIMASFFFAVITRNEAIYSFRHLEYFAYPLSVMSGVAVWEMWGYLGRGSGVRGQGSGVGGPGSGVRVQGSGGKTNAGRADKDGRWTPGQKWLAAATAILIVASGATAYSVQSTTSQFEESISKQVMDTANWMKDDAQTNLTVASDHRISQILWTKGFKVTSDEAYWIFFAPDWRGMLDELNGTGKTYGKVGYVFIDDVMRTKGVQSNLNETPRPITDALYAKFGSEPFELLHRVSNADGTKWAEVYVVNWTYIGNNIG
jgi:hypothetical protein